jgi:hypothetical protein
MGHLSPELRSSVENLCAKSAALSEAINAIKRTLCPKIRDEVLEDAVTLGGMGFFAHFGQCNGGWFPANRLCG